MFHNRPIILRSGDAMVVTNLRFSQLGMERVHGPKFSKRNTFVMNTIRNGLWYVSSIFPGPSGLSDSAQVFFRRSYLHFIRNWVINWNRYMLFDWNMDWIMHLLIKERVSLILWFYPLKNLGKNAELTFFSTWSIVIHSNEV